MVAGRQEATAKSPLKHGPLPRYGDAVFGDDDGVAEPIIPKGVLDPVYEAKARLINRTVRPLRAKMRLPDGRGEG